MSANEDSCVNVTHIPFGDAFATMSAAMQEVGGRIKVTDPANGTLEASWRHGLNMFGLRVTARFRALDDGQVEVTVKAASRTPSTPLARAAARRWRCSNGTSP